MDRLFAGHERPRAVAFPPVNVWSGEDGMIVTAELPGVDPTTLEITAVRDGLTLRGERATFVE
jgi:HSP20 family protein